MHGTKLIQNSTFVLWYEAYEVILDKYGVFQLSRENMY